MPRIRVLFFLFMIACVIFEAQCQQQATDYQNILQIKDITVYGKSIDKQTRCKHWHSELDVIAIKFKCCDKYYPCFSCHKEVVKHEHQVWPRSEFDQNAVLCGVCGHELSIKDYMNANNICPNCQAMFNPGCSNHYYLYFEVNR